MKKFKFNLSDDAVQKKLSPFASVVLGFIIQLKDSLIYSKVDLKGFYQETLNNLVMGYYK